MLEKKKDYDAIELIASAARTAATGNGDAVRMPGMVAGFGLVLDVTVTATAVGDLLDVYIQTKLDGTNWLDVYRFTQCLGNGNAKRYIGKLVADTALTEFENGAALGEHTGRALLGDDWRVRWAITDAGADDASFTFSVTACPM